MLKSRKTSDSPLRFSGHLNTRTAFVRRDIFVLGNDAYMFMESCGEFKYDRASFDSVCDFHRFQAVFHRIMGW